MRTPRSDSLASAERSWTARNKSRHANREGPRQQPGAFSLLIRNEGFGNNEHGHTLHSQQKGANDTDHTPSPRGPL